MGNCRPKAVDCHVHILPPDVVSDLGILASKDESFRNLTMTKGAEFVTGKELLRDMAEGGLEKAAIFGFSLKDNDLNSYLNDYVLSFAQDNPGKFAPLACISPAGKGFMKEAERCLSLGFMGFGELFPASHGFDLAGKEMSRLAGLSSEKKVPMLIHVNEQVGHMYPGKGDVGLKKAFMFAQKFKENPVIFAHLGGGLPFFYSMPEVKALHNVFYDTAAQPYLMDSSVYRSMRETGALEKVVLGTDYPLLKSPRYFKEMEKSGLSKEDIQKVIYDNPLKILRFLH